MDSDEGAHTQPRRSDPDGRVRDELSRLGTDPDSAPEVPTEVTARIRAALRAAPPPTGGDRRNPAHAVRAPLPPVRRIALIIGACTAVLAAGLGALMLVERPASTPSAEVTASTIAVAPTRPTLAVSDAELRDLLSAEPQLGPLSDPDRRAGCLRGLGYTDPDAVLGARPLDVDGSPGVLLLLPATAAHLITAVAVAPHCGPEDPATLTERRILRR
ncbi:hypothetical protein [Mycolicibacterium thermoresistibile]